MIHTSKYLRKKSYFLADIQLHKWSLLKLPNNNTNQVTCFCAN